MVWARTILLVTLALCAPELFAQTNEVVEASGTNLSDLLNEQGELVIATESTTENGSQWSVSLQILLAMTLLSLVPALLMTMTCFTRVIVVLAILRQALGLQQTPSNQILIGMTLFMTYFIMAPVFNEAVTNGLTPWLNGSIDIEAAGSAMIEPFHRFMLMHTRATDLQLFADIAKVELPDDLSQTPMRLLAPAFLTSELKTAFHIGFMLFVPFLVIDLVVSSVLMAMGMMMLSPLIISLPFKILIFVLVDGWALVVGTLASSYGVG